MTKKVFDQIAEGLQEALEHARAPQEPALATDAEAEPVAWRWRRIGQTVWIYDPDPVWLEEHQNGPHIEAEPLYAHPPSSVPPPENGKLIAELAAALTRLGVTSTCSPTQVDGSPIHEWQVRAEKAEAEVTRLREALTEIAEGEWYYAGSTIQGGPDPTRKVPGRWATIARAALNPAG